MKALLEELAAPLLIAAIGYLLGRAHARFEREELKALHHLEHELGPRRADRGRAQRRQDAVQTDDRPAAAIRSRRKLSDEQERELTRLYSETHTPISQIASRFGIGQTSVQRMAQRNGAGLRGHADSQLRATLQESLPTGARGGGTAEAESKPQPSPPAVTSRVRTRVAASKTASTSRRQAAPQTASAAPPQASRRRKRQTSRQPDSSG